MNHDLQLTPAQVAHAKLAGIPADRPGLLGEYPLAMFRARKADEAAPAYLNQAFKTQGVDVSMIVVDDAEAEAAASADGWTRTVDGKTEKVVSEKDARIAELEAQVAVQEQERDARLGMTVTGQISTQTSGELQSREYPAKRGPGRPPNPKPE